MGSIQGSVCERLVPVTHSRRNEKREENHGPAASTVKLGFYQFIDPYLFKSEQTDLVNPHTLLLKGPRSKCKRKRGATMLNFGSFVHRHNRDGRYDAICTACFMTAATVENEWQLASLESAHICDPEMLHRICDRCNGGTEARAVPSLESITHPASGLTGRFKLAVTLPLD